jgi:hypothetical protein
MKYIVEIQKNPGSAYVKYLSYSSPKDDSEGYTAHERAKDKARELVKRGNHNARIRINGAI